MYRSDVYTRHVALPSSIVARQFEYSECAPILAVGGCQNEIAFLHSETGRMLVKAPASNRPIRLGYADTSAISLQGDSSVMAIGLFNGSPSSSCCRALAATGAGAVSMISFDIPSALTMATDPEIATPAWGSTPSFNDSLVDLKFVTKLSSMSVTSLTVNSDNSLFSVCGGQGFSLLDTVTANTLREYYAPHRGNIVNLTRFSRTQPSVFASCSLDGSVCLWDSRDHSDHPAISAKCSQQNVVVSFSPDDTRLLVSGSENGASQLHVSTGTRFSHVELPHHPGESMYYTRAYYGNGGETIVSGASCSDLVSVCDAETGALLQSVHVGVTMPCPKTVHVQSLRADPLNRNRATVLLVNTLGVPSCDLVEVQLDRTAAEAVADAHEEIVAVAREAVPVITKMMSERRQFGPQVATGAEKDGVVSKRMLDALVRVTEVSLMPKTCKDSESEDHHVSSPSVSCEWQTRIARQCRPYALMDPLPNAAEVVASQKAAAETSPGGVHAILGLERLLLRRLVAAELADTGALRETAAVQLAALAEDMRAVERGADPGQGSRAHPFDTTGEWKARADSANLPEGWKAVAAAVESVSIMDSDPGYEDDLNRGLKVGMPCVEPVGGHKLPSSASLSRLLRLMRSCKDSSKLECFPAAPLVSDVDAAALGAKDHAGDDSNAPGLGSVPLGSASLRRSQLRRGRLARAPAARAALEQALRAVDGDVGAAAAVDVELGQREGALAPCDTVWAVDGLLLAAHAPVLAGTSPLMRALLGGGDEEEAGVVGKTVSVPLSRLFSLPVPAVCPPFPSDPPALAPALERAAELEQAARVGCVASGSKAARLAKQAAGLVWRRMQSQVAWLASAAASAATAAVGDDDNDDDSGVLLRVTTVGRCYVSIAFPSGLTIVSNVPSYSPKTTTKTTTKTKIRKVQAPLPAASLLRVLTYAYTRATAITSLLPLETRTLLTSWQAMVGEASAAGTDMVRKEGAVTEEAYARAEAAAFLHAVTPLDAVRSGQKLPINAYSAGEEEEEEESTPPPSTALSREQVVALAARVVVPTPPADPKPAADLARGLLRDAISRAQARAAGAAGFVPCPRDAAPELDSAVPLSLAAARRDAASALEASAERAQALADVESEGRRVVLHGGCCLGYRRDALARRATQRLEANPVEGEDERRDAAECGCDACCAEWARDMLATAGDNNDGDDGVAEESLPLSGEGPLYLFKDFNRTIPLTEAIDAFAKTVAVSVQRACPGPLEPHAGDVLPLLPHLLAPSVPWNSVVTGSAGQVVYSKARKSAMARLAGAPEGAAVSALGGPIAAQLEKNVGTAKQKIRQLTPRVRVAMYLANIEMAEISSKILEVYIKQALNLTILSASFHAAEQAPPGKKPTGQPSTKEFAPLVCTAMKLAMGLIEARKAVMRRSLELHTIVMATPESSIAAEGDELDDVLAPGYYERLISLYVSTSALDYVVEGGDPMGASSCDPESQGVLARVLDHSDAWPSPAAVWGKADLVSAPPLVRQRGADGLTTVFVQPESERAAAVVAALTRLGPLGSDAIASVHAKAVSRERPLALRPFVQKSGWHSQPNSVGALYHKLTGKHGDDEPVAQAIASAVSVAAVAASGVFSPIDVTLSSSSLELSNAASNAAPAPATTGESALDFDDLNLVDHCFPSDTQHFLPKALMRNLKERIKSLDSMLASVIESHHSSLSMNQSGTRLSSDIERGDVTCLHNFIPSLSCEEHPSLPLLLSGRGFRRWMARFASSDGKERRFVIADETTRDGATRSASVGRSVDFSVSSGAELVDPEAPLPAQCPLLQLPEGMDPLPRIPDKSNARTLRWISWGIISQASRALPGAAFVECPLDFRGIERAFDSRTDRAHALSLVGRVVDSLPSQCRLSEDIKSMSDPSLFVKDSASESTLEKNTAAVKMSDNVAPAWASPWVAPVEWVEEERARVVATNANDTVFVADPLTCAPSLLMGLLTQIITFAASPASSPMAAEINRGRSARVLWSALMISLYARARVAAEAAAALLSVAAAELTAMSDQASPSAGELMRQWETTLGGIDSASLKPAAGASFKKTEEDSDTGIMFTTDPEAVSLLAAETGSLLALDASARALVRDPRAAVRVLAAASALAVVAAANADEEDDGVVADGNASAAGSLRVDGMMRARVTDNERCDTKYDDLSFAVPSLTITTSDGASVNALVAAAALAVTSPPVDTTRSRALRSFVVAVEELTGFSISSVGFSPSDAKTAHAWATAQEGLGSLPANALSLDDADRLLGLFFGTESTPDSVPCRVRFVPERQLVVQLDSVMRATAASVPSKPVPGDGRLAGPGAAFVASLLLAQKPLLPPPTAESAVELTADRSVTSADLELGALMVKSDALGAVAVLCALELDAVFAAAKDFTAAVEMEARKSSGGTGEESQSQGQNQSKSKSEVKSQIQGMTPELVDLSKATEAAKSSEGMARAPLPISVDAACAHNKGAALVRSLLCAFSAPFLIKKARMETIMPKNSAFLYAALWVIASLRQRSFIMAKPLTGGKLAQEHAVRCLTRRRVNVVSVLPIPPSGKIWLDRSRSPHDTVTWWRAITTHPRLETLASLHKADRGIRSAQAIAGTTMERAKLVSSALLAGVLVSAVGRESEAFSRALRSKLKCVLVAREDPGSLGWLELVQPASTPLAKAALENLDTATARTVLSTSKSRKARYTVADHLLFVAAAAHAGDALSALGGVTRAVEAVYLSPVTKYSAKPSDLENDIPYVLARSAHAAAKAAIASVEAQTCRWVSRFMRASAALGSKSLAEMSRTNTAEQEQRSNFAEKIRAMSLAPCPPRAPLAPSEPSAHEASFVETLLSRAMAPAPPARGSEAPEARRTSPGVHTLYAQQQQWMSIPASISFLGSLAATGGSAPPEMCSEIAGHVAKELRCAMNAPVVYALVDAELTKIYANIAAGVSAAVASKHTEEHVSHAIGALETILDEALNFIAFMWTFYSCPALSSVSLEHIMKPEHVAEVRRRAAVQTPLLGPNAYASPTNVGFSGCAVQLISFREALHSRERARAAGAMRRAQGLGALYQRDVIGARGRQPRDRWPPTSEIRALYTRGAVARQFTSPQMSTSPHGDQVHQFENVDDDFAGPTDFKDPNILLGAAENTAAFVHDASRLSSDSEGGGDSDGDDQFSDDEHDEEFFREVAGVRYAGQSEHSFSREQRRASDVASKLCRQALDGVPASAPQSVSNAAEKDRADFLAATQAPDGLVVPAWPFVSSNAPSLLLGNAPGLNSFSLYDPVTQHFTALVTTGLPSTISLCQSKAHLFFRNGTPFIVAVGGDLPRGSVAQLHVPSLHWNVIEPSQENIHASPRRDLSGYASMTTHDSLLLCFGTTLNTISPTIYRLDLDTLRWHYHEVSIPQAVIQAGVTIMLSLCSGIYDDEDNCGYIAGVGANPTGTSLYRLDVARMELSLVFQCESRRKRSHNHEAQASDEDGNDLPINNEFIPAARVREAFQRAKKAFNPAHHQPRPSDYVASAALARWRYHPSGQKMAGNAFGPFRGLRPGHCTPAARSLIALLCAESEPFLKSITGNVKDGELIEKEWENALVHGSHKTDGFVNTSRLFAVLNDNLPAFGHDEDLSCAFDHRESSYLFQDGVLQLGFPPDMNTTLCSRPRSLGWVLRMLRYRMPRSESLSTWGLAVGCTEMWLGYVDGRRVVGLMGGRLLTCDGVHDPKNAVLCEPLLRCVDLETGVGFHFATINAPPMAKQSFMMVRSATFPDPSKWTVAAESIGEIAHHTGMFTSANATLSPYHFPSSGKNEPVQRWLRSRLTCPAGLNSTGAAVAAFHRPPQHRHSARYLHLLGGFSVLDEHAMSVVQTGVDVFDTWTGVCVRFIPVANAPIHATPSATLASLRTVLPRSLVIRSWLSGENQRARNAGAVSLAGALAYPLVPSRIAGFSVVDATGSRACGWGGIDSARDFTYLRRGIDPSLCREADNPLQGIAVEGDGNHRELVHRISLLAAGPLFAPSLSSRGGAQMLRAMTAGSSALAPTPVAKTVSVRPGVLSALLRVGYTGDVDWSILAPFVHGRQDWLPQEACDALAGILKAGGTPLSIVGSPRSSTEPGTCRAAPVQIPWYARLLQPSTARSLTLMSLVDSRMRAVALEKITLLQAPPLPQMDMAAFTAVAWALPYAVSVMKRSRAHATQTSDVAELVSCIASDPEAVEKLQSAVASMESAAPAFSAIGSDVLPSMMGRLPCRASVTCVSAGKLVSKQRQAKLHRERLIDPIETLGAIEALQMPSPLRSALEQALIRVATVDSLPMLLAASQALSLPRLASRLALLAAAALPVLWQNCGAPAANYKRLVSPEMQSAILIVADLVKPKLPVLSGSIALVSMIELLVARKQESL